MKCSICKDDIRGQVIVNTEGVQQVVDEHGNNAYPINDGRCCDSCNLNVVIPARIKLLTK